MTPPGWYQSIMTLKMSCARLDIYPGFIDVQSREAGSTEVEHQYVAPGNAVSQNLTEDKLTMEKRKRKSAKAAEGSVNDSDEDKSINGNDSADADDSEPKEHPHGNDRYDELIADDMSKLFKDLLYYWDGSGQHKARLALAERLKPKPKKPTATVERHKPAQDDGEDAENDDDEGGD